MFEFIFLIRNFILNFLETVKHYLFQYFLSLLITFTLLLQCFDCVFYLIFHLLIILFECLVIDNKLKARILYDLIFICKSIGRVLFSHFRGIFRFFSWILFNCIFFRINWKIICLNFFRFDTKLFVFEVFLELSQMRDQK